MRDLATIIYQNKKAVEKYQQEKELREKAEKAEKDKKD